MDNDIEVLLLVVVGNVDSSDQVNVVGVWTHLFDFKVFSGISLRFGVFQANLIHVLLQIRTKFDAFSGD